MRKGTGEARKGGRWRRAEEVWFGGGRHDLEWLVNLEGLEDGVEKENWDGICAGSWIVVRGDRVNQNMCSGSGEGNG